MEWKKIITGEECAVPTRIILCKNGFVSNLKKEDLGCSRSMRQQSDESRLWSQLMTTAYFFKP
jgi:hypothetical protein